MLQALTHDKPYGGLTRTIGSSLNDWWQGASPGTTYDDQATAAAPTLANISKWSTVCRRHLPVGIDGRNRPKNPLYMFVGESIYQDIQAQLEGRSELKDVSVMKAKYGFNAMNVYNVEIVEDSWMTLNSMTAAMLLLNPDTWQFRVAPSRAFTMKPFVWQAEQIGGIDAYVGRIMLAGNLTCKMPRANMYLSAVA